MVGGKTSGGKMTIIQCTGGLNFNPSSVERQRLQRFSITLALQGFFFPTLKCVFGGCQSSIME